MASISWDKGDKRGIRGQGQLRWPVIEQLRRTGLYLTDALWQHILREVGE